MEHSVPAWRRNSPLILGWLGVIAAFAWSVLRSGTGILPGYEVVAEAAAIWPDRIERPFESFAADSPLNLIAFKIMGLHTPVQGLWLHLAAIVLAMVGLAAWAASMAPEDRWRAARLSLLAPISTVMLAWIGAYDPFTMLCWVIALFAWRMRSRGLIVAAGLLLGFQHFEHALLGTLALTCTWFALGSRRPKALDRSPLWLILGELAGKALLTVIFLARGETISGRTEWIGPFLKDWTTVAVNVGPTLIWSLFAGMWALVVWLFVESDRRPRLWLTAAILIGGVASFFSGDRPRVFVIILAPALLLAIVVAARELRRQRIGLIIESIVWLAPPVLLWGKVVVNANAWDLIQIARQVLMSSS